jgi:hypothetical protein
MSTKIDVAQIRMNFLLRHLPDAMRSDVLSDPEVAKAVGGVHRPIKLSSDLIISREELFATFRDLFGGEVRDRITALNGDLIEAEVSSDPDGVAAITVGHTQWRFVHADLLARDAERRMAAFERAAAAHTLTAAEEETWRGRVRNEPLNDDSFMELVAVLEATPESFACSLNKNLNNKEVSPRHLLPDDGSYWDRLIPPPGNSEKLTDYVATELDARRRTWLARDLCAGLRRSALEFAAPGMVRDELLNSYANDLPAALESVTTLNDHFALVGIFEICARRIGIDGRLVPAGTRLLERVFSRMESLEAQCAVFGASFIIATARLATHEELRRRPVYWRRLAAAAHASLLARTSAIEGVNHHEILKWANSVAGGDFLLSCLLDRGVEPRWRPEWIDGRHLMADAVGRVLNAWRGIDEAARPEEWRTYIEVGERWVQDTGSGLAGALPAVLEGGLQRDDLDSQSMLPELATVIQTFIDDPTPNGLVDLGWFVFVLGVSSDLVTALRRFIEANAQSHISNEQRIALIFGVHLAVERKDVALADAVVQASFQTALYSTDRALVRKAVLTVIECTGAYRDDEGGDLLVKRLEQLALWRRNPLLPTELSAIVPHLKRVGPNLRTKLARPLAALELAPA